MVTAWLNVKMDKMDKNGSVFAVQMPVPYYHHPPCQLQMWRLLSPNTSDFCSQLSVLSYREFMWFGRDKSLLAFVFCYLHTVHPAEFTEWGRICLCAGILAEQPPVTRVTNWTEEFVSNTINWTYRHLNKYLELNLPVFGETNVLQSIFTVVFLIYASTREHPQYIEKYILLYKRYD